MGSSHLFLLLLTLFSLSIHCSPSPILQAAIHHDPKAFYNCTTNTTFAANSAYHSNIRTLLDWLTSNGTINAGYYNTTVASKNTADTVYGFFYCMRDATQTVCQLCVTEAAKLISSLCTTAKEAILWHQVCFVRYSNRYFFSTVEESPQISFANDKDYVGQVSRFNNILWDMMNDVRTRASSASDRFAYKEVNITDNQKLHGSAWCPAYLSMEYCSWCLSDAIAEITSVCCKGKSGGTVLYPSCGVKFELYPYHMPDSGVPPPPLPSSTHPSAPPGFVAMIIPH